MSLTELGNHHAGTIQQVGGRGAFRRRLLEMGLVPGTRIERIGRAPLGDPLSFRVRGAVVTLRRQEAQLVEIEAA